MNKYIINLRRNTCICLKSFECIKSWPMHLKLAQKNYLTTAKTDILPNFEYGMIWEDPVNGHQVGCLDVSKKEDIEKLMKGGKAVLAVQDPPYNVDINDEFGNFPLEEYINWSEKRIDNTVDMVVIQWI